MGVSISWSRRVAGALFWTAIALGSTPAWCAGEILDVLQRSQLVQLEALPEAPRQSERARIVRASFDRLMMRVDVPAAVVLHVTRGDVLAECLMGRVIVANESLADMSEGERMFVLAHELGHVAQGHWSQLGRLFQRHIPDEVVQHKTDPIAHLLGREASQMAHAHEFEADAYAWRVVSQLGYPPEETAMALFMRLSVIPDTATHPGTRKRIAHLRSLRSAP